MNAKEFQAALHNLAFDLGAESNRLFLDSYQEDWPDEESTTGALFGALVNSIRSLTKMDQSRNDYGIEFKAEFSKKSAEAEHGADVFVHFRCDEPHWKIRTTTVLQAKRVEPNRSMTSGDHERLSTQLTKMLTHTTESFVLMYSRDGIHVLPAVAAQALQTRHLFDADTITWQWFLSGIFRGRMGETDPNRLPDKPAIVVTITASARKAAPRGDAMTAGG
ncbi:hypothetical protein [Bosea beijingensis]